MASAGAEPSAEVCNQVDAAFTFSLFRPHETAQRFEVRRCSMFESKILVWSDASLRPSLAVDIDSGIVQMYAGYDVAIFEISSGTMSRLVIVGFRSGKPHLDANIPTQDTPIIRSDETVIDVRVKDFTDGTWKRYTFKKVH